MGSKHLPLVSFAFCWVPSWVLIEREEGEIGGRERDRGGREKRERDIVERKEGED